MIEDKIKQDIIKIIVELFKDKGFDTDIIEYADLIDDLGMDSITFISIVVEIESYFNITIPDELLAMDCFRCVDNIQSIIQNKLSKKLEKIERKENDKT